MYPVLAHTEHFGRSVGQINNAVLWHRPAIVNADDYRPVILQVRDLDPGAEGQRTGKRGILTVLTRLCPHS